MVRIRKENTGNHLFFPLNSLPNEKFIDWSKLKAFADDEINVISKQKSFLGSVENNLWYNDYMYKF